MCFPAAWAFFENFLAQVKLCDHNLPAAAVFLAYTLKIWRTPLRFRRMRSFLFYLFCGKSLILPHSGPDYAFRFLYAVCVFFYPTQTQLVAAFFPLPLINRRNDIKNAACGEKNPIRYHSFSQMAQISHTLQILG
jgi:hypothetical protein